MSMQMELVEIKQYLKQLGERWSIQRESWVKEIIKSLLTRRAEILSSL